MGIGIAVCLFFAGLLAPMVASAQGAATLSTDKADYHPGEIVHITGSGYAPDTEYAVPVKRPDGSIVTIDPSTHVATPGWHTVTTDAGGHLVYDYQLNGVQGSYEARAYPAAWSGDWSETPVASATFTDAATGDLDQCANGPLSAPVQCAGTAWQNGNLNATKAHYLEGDSIPYRLKFNGLATGATVHTVTIAWDTTDSGKHGIDYLTSYDRTEATADPCSDILAAACGSFDTEPIPIDTNVTNGPDNLPTGTDNITQAPGIFTLYGGASGQITGVSGYSLDSGTYTAGSGYSAGSITKVTISFRTSISHPVLAWGGHVSKRQEWAPEGTAATINGSPYHMRLKDVDGQGGNQDRSLSADTVISPATLTITKQASPEGETAFPFTAAGLSPAAFSLVDDGAGPGTNVQSYPSITSFADFNIVETPIPAGWSLDSIQCTDPDNQTTTNVGTATAAVDIDEAEDLACVFNDSRQTGTIEIEKQTTPAGGTGFGFTGTDLPGTSDDTFSLDDDGVKTINNVPTGTYHVSEDTKAGWDLTGIVCTDPDNGTTTSGSQATIDVDAGETVHCTFNNREEGKLIVKKETDPNGSTAQFDFDPAANLDAGPNFQLADGGSKSYDVDPGTYTVAELAKANWDLTSISCDDGDSTVSADTATFRIAAGETVTCTFNNRQEGKLIVKKETDPNGSTAQFDFDPAANLDAGPNFQLADGGSKSYDVDPGTYTVAELAKANWDLTSISCDDGDSTVSADTATFRIAAGETVTCTFNNRQEGKLIVKKETDPNGSTAQFDFDPAANLDAGPNFQLADGGSKSYDVDPGTYTVAELAKANWDLTSISCDDGDSTVSADTATFRIAAGETVTCTFNNRQEGKLIVKKETDPNGSTAQFDFDPAANLDAGPNFQLADGGSKSYDVDPGTYTVAELAKANWDLTSISCDDGDSTVSADTATFRIAAGETVTCTFNNRQEGKLIVKKETDPNGSTAQFDFDPAANLDAGPNFQLADGGSKSYDVDPGTYTVAELAKANWDLTSISCDDGDSTVSADTATFRIAAGETVTCTFNNRQEGKLIVKKETDPNGSTAQFDFDPAANLDAGPNFQLADGGSKSYDVDPGTYTVAELAKANWDLTSISCDDGDSTVSADTATFRIAAGETVTCTFNNRQEGKLIVKKETDPNGSTAQFDFDPAANLDAGPNFQLADGGSKSYDVDPGTYTVAELAKANWDLTSISCDDGDSTVSADTATFRIAAGETVTCTFNNRQEGKLIVKKETDPNGSTAQFDFDPAANLDAGPNFQLADGGSKSYDVDPGTYTVAELAKANWDLTSISCDDGDSTVSADTATFRIAAGETVTCTFNNRQEGKLIVKKETDPERLDGTVRLRSRREPRRRPELPRSPTAARSPMTSTPAPTRSPSSPRRTGI